MKKKCKWKCFPPGSRSKILLRLKLLTFFVLVSMVTATASSYSQQTKFNLKLDGVTVREVFQEIESNSKFIVLYNESHLDVNRKVTIDVNNSTVESILNQVFAGTNNTYRIYDRQIVILEGEKKESLSVLKTEANAEQKKEISGTVKDVKGIPLPGATVMVKGTTVGTITDTDGKFTLNIPADAKILLFSFVGMITQEITLGNQTNIKITLKEKVLDVSEVVVVGYGAQKKQSVVGSIATVGSKELMQRGGVYNLGQAISGQMPGVTVMEISGEPGRNDPQILIRGMATWNGSDPLILVDGIERRMGDIDINEVDNISVLKDASATAVFGVKGANGVILITTKRGQEGKPQLSLSAATGLKSVSKINGVMDAFEAQSWRNAAIVNEVSANENSWQYYIPYQQLLYSKKPQVAPYSYLYPNVDWKSVLFREFAPNSRFNLNLSGGTSFAKYFASVGYTHEGDLYKSEYNSSKGYDPGYAYDRLNFRGNIDFQLTKTTKLSTNLSGMFGARKSPASTFTSNAFGLDEAAGAAYLYRGYYEYAPDFFPVKYPDGRYGLDASIVTMPNPLAALQEGGYQVTNRRQINTDIKLEQKLDFITKGLSASANVSYDIYVTSNGPSLQDGNNQGQALYEYIDPNILNAKNHQDTLNAITYFASGQKTGINDYDFILQPWQTLPEAVIVKYLQRTLFYQASLNYARTFGKHDVTGLFLFNRRQDATGEVFPNYREDWVGRATYNYDSKYFAEVNGAYNGSEKFSTKYRFGFFPSMALGWMVSNEKFMKKMGWIDKFKIRGSIGQIGSDAGIPRWGYVGSWSTGTGGNQYDVNGTLSASPYPNYYEGTIPNPEIRWETATKRNLGAEISLLQRLVTLDFDIYKDNRKNIFMTSARRNIPNLFGAAAVPSNLGATETSGYEIALGFNKNWANGIGLWIKQTIAQATDVVLASEDPPMLAAYQKVAGFQINQTKSQLRTNYMNNWDDVYGSSPATSSMVQRLPGDWDINDFNGDGIINSYDNVPYGYPTRPRNTYSTTLGMNYKNFSFMVQFYGVNDITLVPRYKTPEIKRYVAISELFRDYWTPQNMDALNKAPRFITTSASGERFYQDASFLRLKTAEISYNLPSRINKFLGLSSCTIYLQGNNLFLWSKFPADFETGTVDIANSYPMYKLYNLGVDIKF